MCHEWISQDLEYIIPLAYSIDVVNIKNLKKEEMNWGAVGNSLKGYNIKVCQYPLSPLPTWLGRMSPKDDKLHSDRWMISTTQNQYMADFGWFQLESFLWALFSNPLSGVG